MVGLCGEPGLPGGKMPATIGGTLESCLLEELGNCKRFEEDIDSANALFDSRMD
jgi:hypothetical protein